MEAFLILAFILFLIYFLGGLISAWLSGGQTVVLPPASEETERNDSNIDYQDYQSMKRHMYAQSGTFDPFSLPGSGGSLYPDPDDEDPF